MKRTGYFAAAVAVSMIVQIACTTVFPITTERTGPTVFFRQAGSVSPITTTALAASGPLVISCIATDNGGRQLRCSYRSPFLALR